MDERYKNYTQEQINDAFLDACMSGNLEQVHYFLTSPELTIHAQKAAKTRDNLNFAGFDTALMFNRVEVVKYLLDSAKDVQAEKDEAFKTCCVLGRVETLKYLIVDLDCKLSPSIQSFLDEPAKTESRKNAVNYAKMLFSVRDEEKKLSSSIQEKTEVKPDKKKHKI